MGAVPAVKVDACPVDELRARPEGGGPQSVEFVEHPLVAAAHAAGAVIEPDHEPLAGDVAAVGADLEGAGQEWAIVVEPPGLKQRRLGAAARALRQPGQIGRRDQGIPGRVTLFEKRLP